MTVDISLIPQERVLNLLTKLNEIETNISNIGTDTTNNLVHKTGSESIGGNKTFTDTVNLQSTTADISTTNTYDIGPIQYRDKNGNSYFYTKGYQDSTRRMFEIGGNYGTNNWKYSLQAGYDYVNDKIFLRTPKPSATNSSNGIDVPTTGWVNDPSYSTNVVHRTGDETIDGNKTFTGYTSLNTPTIKKQNTENEGGQIYFERSDGDVTMNDNNHPYIDFWSGKFRFIGQSSSQSGSSVNIPFSVDIQNNCLCHGNSMKVMNYVVATYISGTDWYRVWSDGWIEQGGQFTGSTTINGSTTTVTFIIPFTSYVAIAGGFTKSSNSAPYGQNLWQNGPTTLTTMVCSIPAYGSNGNINHASSAGTGYWYACGY